LIQPRPAPGQGVLHTVSQYLALVAHTSTIAVEVAVLPTNRIFSPHIVKRSEEEKQSERQPEIP
jgi:hypothetical protein